MLINRRVPQAGVYAEWRYQRGLRSWRRATNRTLVLIFGPFILAGLAVLAVDRQGLSWVAGGIFGIFTMSWVIFRDTPPRYVEKWHDGAEGERKTEKALKPLEEDGWSVTHDIQGRYGNYDHIAVGVTGVYLLETKNLQGIVEIRDGLPRLNRRHDPEETAIFARARGRALAAAVRIKEDIQARSGHSVWVQAVVVFWSAFPEQLVDDGRCVYIHGPRLKDWLSNQPRRLNTQQVSQIAAAVGELAEERRRYDAVRAPT